MKALRYIIYGLLAAAVVGLLCYQGFVTHELDSSNLSKALLILAGILLSLTRPLRQQRKVANKKLVYQKAYSDFIQEPFADDKKLERQFYSAVHDYNMNKPAAGIKKLEKLRKECQRSGDLFSVTVFTALCYNDLKLYQEALRHYDAASKIRVNTTLFSNMGLCYYRLGKYPEAEKAYRQAIQIDPKNAYAYNNLSSLCFAQGAYEEALSLAETAIEFDGKLVQALSTAAICCALLEKEAEYDRYYRQAVSNGYDGKKIKSAVESLTGNLL